MNNNIIDLSVYEIDDDTQFHAYTATWCSPCKRIKPVLIETMAKYNYELVYQITVEKSKFKEEINNFIPFFQIVKRIDPGSQIFEKIDSIQTSDTVKFNNFFGTNKIDKILNDDF